MEPLLASFAAQSLPTGLEACLRTALPFPGNRVWRARRRLPTHGAVEVRVERVDGRWMARVRVGRTVLVEFAPPCAARCLRSMGRHAEAEEADRGGFDDAVLVGLRLAAIAREVLPACAC